MIRDTDDMNTKTKISIPSISTIKIYISFVQILLKCSVTSLFNVLKNSFIMLIKMLGENVFDQYYQVSSSIAKTS
jgi:hypothetical protein